MKILLYIYIFIYIIIKMIFEYLQLSDRYKNVQPLEFNNLMFLFFTYFTSYLYSYVITSFKFVLEINLINMFYNLFCINFIIYYPIILYLIYIFIHDYKNKTENEYWFINYIYVCIFTNIVVNYIIYNLNEIKLLLFANIFLFNIFIIYYLDHKYYEFDYIYNYIIYNGTSFILFTILLNYNIYLSIIIYFATSTFTLMFYYNDYIKDNVYSISIIIV